MTKILGIGNAVLDILAKISEKDLKKRKLFKGSMSLVEEEESSSLLNQINPIKKDSGGSVANTIVGVSILGGDANFCGKVKNDEIGKIFEENMRTSKVNFLCKKSEIGLPTARCIVLVTPDGERTMQTFLGASTTLDSEDLEESFFDGTSFLIIEGYLWSSPTARKAIEKAIKIAKQKKIKIMFSLSDQNLVKMYKNEFLKIVEEIDILIGNNDEYKALLNLPNNEEILKKLTKDKCISIMTLGKDGAMAFDTKKVYKVPSFKPSKILDTTGAGDMFASGFLFKINKGESIDEALRYGCKTASRIISQYGARPDQNSFKNI